MSLNIKKNIKWLTKPGGGLSKRAIRGGFWIFLLRIVQQIFGLARLAILARILAPHDFGLMGIALLAMSSLETFAQTGFQAALIQKKGNIEPYLNAAWTVLILRGIILFVVLYFAAPFAASFFEVSKAKPIIQVIGISLLFQAFTNIGVIYFHKELDFNKEFIYQFAGTFTDFIVAIYAVLILKNVWALVFGLLAGNAVRCIVSYLIHPYRPRLSFDLAKAKDLFGFGKWIFGSSIFVFFLTQGDDIFVGKLLGATALGFYQLAYKISNIPATEISHLISTVAFPAYSKLQDNHLKLREAYLQTFQITAFLSIPTAGLIFVLAPDFTKIFLGQKWMPMVSAMQVLALYGALRAIGATTGAVFTAVGKPEISTKIKFAQFALLAIIIYPFTVHLGILGAAIAVASYAFIFNFFAIYKVLYIINSNYRKPVTSLVSPLILTSIMALTILISKKYIFNNISLTSFLFLAVIGIAIYLVFALLLENFFNYGSRRG